MANEQQKPNPNAIIELENTKQDRFVFPVVEVAGPDKIPTVVRRMEIGAAKDRIPFLVEEELRDVTKQPNPIVHWRVSEWDALGPVNQKVIRHYIANGTLRVTQGRELIGA